MITPRIYSLGEYRYHMIGKMTSRQKQILKLKEANLNKASSNPFHMIQESKDRGKFTGRYPSYFNYSVNRDPSIMKKMPKPHIAAQAPGQFQLGSMQGARVRAFQRRIEQTQKELEKKKL